MRWILIFLLLMTCGCTGQTNQRHELVEGNHDGGSLEKTYERLPEKPPQEKERKIWDFQPNCGKDAACPHFPITAIFEWSGKQIGEAYYIVSISNIVVYKERLYFTAYAKSKDYAVSPTRYTMHYAIDFTGKVLWVKHRHGRFGGTLTMTKNGVLLSSFNIFSKNSSDNEYIIHAIRASDGKLLWSHVIPNAEKRRYTMASVANKMVIVGGPNLIAWDEFSGKKLWERSLSEPGESIPLDGEDKPVLGKEHIYVFSSIGNILAFDFQGNKQWSTMIPGLPKAQGAIAIGKDKDLIVSTGYYLFSLSKVGEIKWSAKQSSNRLTIDRHGNIYTTTRGPYYTASYTHEGKKRWELFNVAYHDPNDLLGYAVDPPMTFYDGLFYLGASTYSMGFGWIDFQGVVKQRFTGFDDGRFFTGDFNYIEETGQLVTFFRDPRIPYEPNPTKDTPHQRMLLILIDIGKKKLDGYWPMRFHDPRNSSSVE